MMKNRLLSATMSVSALLLALFCTHPVAAATLDTSFGEDGWITTTVGHFDDNAKAVAVQADGRIVVAGSSSNLSNFDFALVRYTSKGKLDSTFNVDGRVVTDIGGDDDQAFALALLGNGKIIAAGYTFNGTDKDFALVRYNKDGSLDSAFGTGGIVELSFGHADEAITAVAVQEDGAVVAAGFVSGTAGRVTALMRFRSDGSLDQTFGDAGVALIGLGNDAVSNSLGVQEDGSIVSIGTYTHEGRSGVQVMRFLANGSLDESFGTSGVADLILDDEDTAGNGLWLLEDGSILVAGSAGRDHERDIALFRYTASGEADKSFGSGGMVRSDISGEEDAAYDVLMTADTILLTG